MVPTVLDVLGIDPPATIKGVPQSPIQGVSFAHTLNDGAAPTKHHTQYFEMIGNRAIYHDGAGGMPVARPVVRGGEAALRHTDLGRGLSQLDASGWELYHVAEDFTESHNVAADNRDRLIALIGTWYAEAGKYNVLPVDGSALNRLLVERPLLAAPRDRYVYFADTQSVPYFAGPKTLNRPHAITADVEIPKGGAEGVLLSQGAVQAATPSSCRAASSSTSTTTSAGTTSKWSQSHPARGPPQAALRVRADRRPEPARGQGGSGPLQLYVDGALVGETDVPYTTPMILNPGALTCGANPGSSVDAGLCSPFRFTGTIHTVTVDVRRPDRGHRGRGPRGNGPPVASAMSQPVDSEAHGDGDPRHPRLRRGIATRR